MSVVHQVIAGAAPGDAVTMQALRLGELLTAWGFENAILADHVHPAMSGRVSRLRGAADPRLGAGPLIVRYSIWADSIAAALASRTPRAIVYHNVTPGSLLRAANPEVGALCDIGRAHLPDLTGRADVFIADSHFNAHDLHEVGIERVEVVPLLLGAIAAPPARLEARAPSILTVGRIAPNKRIEDVIRIGVALDRTGTPTPVTIVGAADAFERYRAALDGLVRDLDAVHVRFAGRVSDADLEAAFAEASVYCCMSVHEGFCAPLVEAMQHGLPIVARSAGAVPETVGAAGLVLDDDDPYVFAEAVREVSANERLRATLHEASVAQLARFAPDLVADRLRAVLAPVLDGER